MLHFNTILHPTDFSASSESAFHLACALARDHGARLVVLHVYPPAICHGEVVARRQDEGYYEQLAAELGGLKPPAGIAVEYLLEEGDAAEVISRVAEEYPCDLIALGTHGRGGLRRMLMGGVAEAVLRKSSCPVLTIKAGTGPAVAETERSHAAAAPT